MKKLKSIFLILGFLINLASPTSLRAERSNPSTTNSSVSGLPRQASLARNDGNSSNFKAQEPIKIKLEYRIPKAQKIKLRVTEIPRIYPWLERADDGSVAMPELEGTIVCENVEDLKIYDDAGNFFIIPAGTRFYSKLMETKEPKSFWRKGQIKLDFYKISTGSYSLSSYEDQSLANYDGKNFIQPKENLGKNTATLDPQALTFDSKKSSSRFKDGAQNVSRTAGYALAGAILAPLAVYSLSSSLGLGLGTLTAAGALSHPYVLGGIAAAGGAIGMVYGIKKQGKKFNLEPGKELELEIANPWLLTQSFEELKLDKNTELSKEEPTEKFNNDPQFSLLIKEVKTQRDEFGEKSIKISVEYINRTNEDLRLSSFKLIDSTGKEYEASYKSDTDTAFGELPPKGKLDLFFSVDFPNAIHYLRVIKQYNQKPIYTTKIVIGKK